MMAKIRKLKNKKGFTLVELIVVIAIIAVLAAILVPLMGNYLSDSKITAAESGAKSIKNVFSNTMTRAVSQDRGRASTADVGVYTIDITGGTVTINSSGDSEAWTGTGSQGTFVSEVAEQLNNAGDCRAAVGVKGSQVLSCVFISGTVVTVTDVDDLLDGTGMPDAAKIVNNIATATGTTTEGAVVGFA